MTDDEFKSLCLEHGIALFCLHEPNGTYLKLSAACQRITGYTADELVGKNPYDFFHEDDKEIIEKEGHIPILESKEDVTTTEYRFRKKNGQFVWLRSNARAFKNKNNQVDYIFTISADVDEDKRKLDIIHKEELLLEEAGKMARIGAWEIDLETMNLIWSKVTYDIHELDFDTPVNLEKAINFYSPQDRDSIDAAVNTALTMGEGWDNRYQLITAKNNRVWVRAIGRAQTRNGKTVKLFGTFQDITQQVESENEQKALIEQLSKQKKQLVEFNQIVSHNLRSPVSSLSALIHFLEKTEEQAERNEIIKNIKEVNLSLNTLLNDLVDAVKIINDTQVPQEDIDVGEVIDLTKKILDGNIKQLNAKINFDNTAWQKVMFPKLYFESIILNLMSNSLKYHSSERDLIIDIVLTFEKQKKVMLFTDNGLGINLQRYGHKVFKMHKTFHREKQGKGLGLFMTKNQIEAMGGTISVKSEEGKGSTFKVIF